MQVGYNQEVNLYEYPGGGRGVDNLGFDEIPFSIHEGYENEVGSTREDVRTPQIPRADETIKLLRFEEPSSRYHQFRFNNHAIYIYIYLCTCIYMLNNYHALSQVFSDNGGQRRDLCR